MKITFDVNTTVERFIRYDEGENPKNIYYNLMEESSDEEYKEFINKVVLDDFKRIPHLIDTEVETHYGTPSLDCDVTNIPVGECIPRWNEFMSLEQIKRMELEERKNELCLELEGLSCTNNYDLIIKLATELKKLDKED